MDDILKADIFFFVTTLVVAVLGILGAVALAYVIKILHDVRDVARTTREEVQKVMEDVDSMRQDVKERWEEGNRYAREFAASAGMRSMLVSLVQTLFEARRRRSRRSEKED
jgi:hypothetical protein